MPYISKKQLAKLEMVAKAATLQTMSVAFPGETVSVAGSLTGDEDGVFKTDDFIRDRTRIYRESWIIGPLREVIDELNGKA